MTYQVYKSTNKGRSWVLQGTTDIIPQGSFFPGQEGFSFAYSQFRQTASGIESIDGYITAIGTGGGVQANGTFTIQITAPEDPSGTQATATPNMVDAGGGNVTLSSVTITEAGSGYQTTPTVTFFRNGIQIALLTPTIAYRAKYITFSLSGIEWTQNVVTPLGEEVQYIGGAIAKSGSTYFALLVDTLTSTLGIYAGSNPQALTNTNITFGSTISEITEVNDSVYVVIDNNLYVFSGSSWTLVGTLYDETNAATLYPNYYLKNWVTTSQGIYAYVTDSSETTAYIYQTEDLLNYTRVQTLGSVATYPLANQGTYLYTDNSAAFTTTNNLLELQ